MRAEFEAKSGSLERVNGFGDTREDLRTVAFVGPVAFRFSQQLEKLFTRRCETQLSLQIDHACRVAQHLNRLDAREIGKEPAAARKHQQRTALHFQQLK